MYTKCPECYATFRVTEEQLSIADGLVRCGICDAVFNGREHIEEDQEPTTETKDKYYEDEYSDSKTDENTSNEAWRANEKDFHDEDELIKADVVPTVIRDDFGGNVLTRRNSTIQVAVFTLGAIVLAIFFLGQITYWQNINVLPQAWINIFCNPIGCGDQNKRDLTAIKILNRNIFTHPNAENALMITTTIVNQAQHKQPYPLLQISLLDTQGQIVAVRRFSPNDYLVNKSLADTLMPPDQPVGARLEVLDPGSQVIAYEFEFF